MHPLQRACYAALLALILPACAPGPGTGSPNAKYYFVRKGDNLYRIALEYGLDYRDLAELNGIPEPYVITPGQRLALRTWAQQRARAKATAPLAASKTQSPSSWPVTAPAPMPQARPSAPPSYTPPPPPPGRPVGAPAYRPEPVQRPVVTASAPAAGGAGPGMPPGNGRWRWPAFGRTARAFAAGHGGNKGLDIAGTHGAPVYAAGDGVVVYAGDGLRQYGNLIIIKHDAEYLSAYGYLARAQVLEGDRVRAGQAIAQMGGSATLPGVLHFEIRRRGVPVNPTPLLGPPPSLADTPR